MKVGCGLALLAGIIFVLAVGALLLLSASESARVTPPSPSPRPEGPVVRFGSAVEGSEYRLTYGFKDFHGWSHQVTCRIDREADERERSAFGYVKGQPRHAVLALLKKEVAARAARAGIEPYFQFRLKGDTYQWEWRVPGAVPQPEFDRAVSECRRLDAWVDNEAPAWIDEREAEEYRRHGFTVENNRIQLDYAGVVRRAVPALANCARALSVAGTGTDMRDRLALFVSFFEDMAYEVPPDEREGRYVHGFWVPTEVMVRGRGDCDSKAAAFCALWAPAPASAMIVLVPHHALVAVEGTPGPNDHFVRLGVRTFVLCEVAGGGGRTHPGAASIKGEYEYVLIEPAAQTRASAGT
jgi:hypothetical protein